MKTICTTSYAVLLGCSLVASGAGAQEVQSLGDRLAQSQKPTAKVEIQIAAGKQDKANYAVVVPRIAEHSPKSITITAVPSEGSVESTTGVCLGAVQAAVVQADAADLRRRKPDCAGKFDRVGQPIYPYYGFMVMRADARDAWIGHAVRNLPAGKKLTVAVGAEGSGGAVTMARLLQADPAWKEGISTFDYGLETALGRVRDGSLDAFFVMDAPNSPLIERVTKEKDAAGNRVFQFGNVRPVDAFYEIKDWSGHALYQKALVASGIFSDTSSVSVDAVLIASNEFREDRAKNGPKAIDGLETALDGAASAIRGDTGTPRAWQPAGR